MYLFLIDETKSARIGIGIVLVYKSLQCPNLAFFLPKVRERVVFKPPLIFFNDPLPCSFSLPKIRILICEPKFSFISWLTIVYRFVQLGPNPVVIADIIYLLPWLCCNLFTKSNSLQESSYIPWKCINNLTIRLHWVCYFVRTHRQHFSLATGSVGMIEDIILPRLI